MKATCPRCGTKANHESITSPVRTWFRCADCSFVWRGSLLAMAVRGVPRGTVPHDRDAGEAAEDRDRKPTSLDTPASRDAPLSQDDLDRQLAGVEAELENSTTKPRQWAGAVATAQERQNGGSGRHSRDVNTWLDGVEHAFAPHALASSGDPVEALDPTLDTRRTPRVNTDLNEWLSVVDTSGGARRGHAETALVETAPVATDLGYPWLTETSSDGALTSEESWLSELEASTPAAVRPADAPEPDTVPELGSLSAPNRAASFNGAGLGATIETRPNLGDLMRHLDTFYSGLVQMERRLNSISASYAQVVDRWHPATLDLERKTTRSRPATG